MVQPVHVAILGVDPSIETIDNRVVAGEGIAGWARMVHTIRGGIVVLAKSVWLRNL